MSSESEDVQPVAGRTNDNSWSTNLELPPYADDRDLLVEYAKGAVRYTTPGHHVNFVTHENHGHPHEYLCSELNEAFDDIETKYVEQWECGGHVVRATILQ